MAPKVKTKTKTMDYLLEKVLKRLDKIEANLDLAESDDSTTADVFAMENEHDKAEAELIEVLCDRVAKLEKEAHKLDVKALTETVASRA